MSEVRETTCLVRAWSWNSFQLLWRVPSRASLANWTWSRNTWTYEEGGRKDSISSSCIRFIVIDCAHTLMGNPLQRVVGYSDDEEEVCLFTWQ